MNVNTAGAAIVIALATPVVTGCSNGRAWTQQDSWYRPPPSTWRGNVATLDSRYVVVIPEDKRAATGALLATTSVVLLSPVEASNLAGIDVTPDPDMRLYLLRAVYLNEGTGAFHVRQAGTELEVHHESLGRRPVPMNRAAVIVQFKELPTEVYVTCSMAQ
jgi:hypothetical protein